MCYAGVIQMWSGLLYVSAVWDVEKLATSTLTAVNLGQLPRLSRCICYFFLPVVFLGISVAVGKSHELLC